MKQLPYTQDEETGKVSWVLPTNERVRLVKVPDYDMISQCVRIAFIGATLSILANIGFLCLFVEQVKLSGWCFTNFLLLCFVVAYFFVFVLPIINFIKKWHR